MADVFFVASIVLLAIFVAVAVPALLQLRRTLKTAEAFLETTGAKLNRRLDEASATTQTMERVAEQIEHGTAKARHLFDAMGGLGDAVGGVTRAVGGVTTSVVRVNESIRQFPGILGAVAAAAIAGVRAATRPNQDGGQGNGGARQREQEYQRARRPVSDATGW